MSQKRMREENSEDSTGSEVSQLSSICIQSMKTIAMTLKRTEELEGKLAEVTEQLKRSQVEITSLADAKAKAEHALKEHALREHGDAPLKGLWEVLVSKLIKGPSVAMSIITDSRCGLLSHETWDDNDSWMTSRRAGQDLQVATPLRYAVRANRLDVLKEIVVGLPATGRSVKDVLNRKEKHRNPTLVFLAAEAGSIEILRYLLSMGAEVQVTNSGGATPLHRAASQGSVECVEVLLAAGASPFAPTIDGDHPIHYAASYGHGPVVRKLIEHNASLTVRNNKGMTPLDDAIKNGDKDTIEVIRKALKSNR